MKQERRIMVLLLRSHPPDSLGGQLDTSQASIILQQQHSLLVLVPSRLWPLLSPNSQPPDARTLGCLGGVCPASQSAILPQTIAQASGVVSQQHACSVDRPAQS